MHFNDEFTLYSIFSSGLASRHEQSHWHALADYQVYLTSKCAYILYYLSAVFFKSRSRDDSFVDRSHHIHIV
jgi:hypothetical protein